MKSSSPIRDAVVGCYGDWYTIQIAETLNRLNRLARLLIAFSTRRLPDSLREHASSPPAFRLRRALHRLSGKSEKFFQSNFLFGQFQDFDDVFAKSLTEKDRLVFVWAGMARKSIAAAKRYSSKAMLLCGNAHILERQSMFRELYGRDDYIMPQWIEASLEEYETADGILVESTYVKNSLTSRNIPHEKVFVMPPVASGYGEKISGNNNKLIFGTIQLGARKGTDLLLSWWRRLKLYNAELWLIGAWDSRLGPPHALPSSVRYLGYLKGPAFSEAVRQIDVAVFPTHEDGGPRSLFSLMSVGACPVTSENCAGPDHIRNGINGFVIPLEDKNKWLETMSWCSANPAEIRRLGRNAQQYVKDHLTISCYSQFVSRLIEPEMDHYGFR